MKTSTFVFLLIAAVCARPVQGTESSDGKPIVYNHITKDSHPADDAVAKKTYGAKYHIIDLFETKSYTSSKPRKQVPAKPPRDASGKFLTGTVLVVFILDSEGRIIDPFILRSPNPLLNAPVLDAIKQWTGTPARLDGSPVAELSGVRYVVEKPPMPKWVSDLPGAIAIDAKGKRHPLSDSPSFMEDVVKKVQPYHVNSDREHDGEGAGLFQVNIDVKTGIVTDVTAIKSTDSYTLDRNAVAALREWRWKPATWRQVAVPVVFGDPNKKLNPYSGDSTFPKAPAYVPAGIPR